jgi:hypothetical protein
MRTSPTKTYPLLTIQPSRRPLSLLNSVELAYIFRVDSETALSPFVHETLEEFQVESCEDRDDADIDYQPSPEQVSAEH